MKFIFLFIKKNLRHRKSNYILPFISFILSGILLCTSVFYLNLSFDEPPEEVYYYPYQISVNSVGELNDKAIEKAFAGNEYAQFEGVVEYVDIFPAYQNEISTFDPEPITNKLFLTSIPKDTEHAEFYRNFGYNIASLGEYDVFISQYIFHYFRNHIENNVLSLTEFQNPSGEPLNLNIVGIIDHRITDATEFSIICSNDALLETLEKQCGTDTSIYFYSFKDDFIHTRENYDKFRESRNPTELSVNVTTKVRLSRIDDSEIYSGDVGIALFNMFFAVLCIASTLKLKLNRETSDYKKLHSFGLSPVMRFLLPFIDMIVLSFPAYIISLISSVALFSRIAPKNVQTYQTTTLISYFNPTPKIIFLSAAVFFSVIAVVAGILILLYVIRTPRAYHSFVKSSSAVYYRSKSLTIPYIFLRFRRNKAYCLFFIFIVCFPLFIGAMYGTAAANVTSHTGALYSDADILIEQDELTYGYDSTYDIIRDISILDGVEAVYTVEKTNAGYTFIKGETVIAAQFERLDEYTKSQLSEYLTAGSLDDVLNDAAKIAVIDNTGGLTLGETLQCGETGKNYIIGAILKGVPLNGRSLRFYGNEALMQSLNQSEILPADIHIYFAEDITEEKYAALCEKLANMVYDPHARYTNQKDYLQSLDDDGAVSAKAATVMNVMICIISVISVFLLHTQHQMNRQGEFMLLSRLGYSDGKIRSLIYTESYIFVGIGLLIFTLLYGGYVSAVMAAIAEMGSYQYSGFSLAWREILVIAVGIIGVVGISGYLGYNTRRK